MSAFLMSALLPVSSPQMAGKTALDVLPEDMMKSAGGKKTGKEKILGYNCDIREVMGSKIWMYKGVPLKTENNMMGTTYINEAVKARFDIDVPDKYFRLPDYPVVDMPSIDRMMYEDRKTDDNGIETLSGQGRQPLIDYETFRRKTLNEEPGTPEEEIKRAYELYEKMMQTNR